MCLFIFGHSTTVTKLWRNRGKPFKDEAQIALFKDPVRTAL